MGTKAPGWRPASKDMFNQVEHWLYVGLAALLCCTCVMALGGSAAMLWAGLSDWAGTGTIFAVIERLLVVLMLVEILHTVLVSVRSGSLTPEPFLVVGLIASIRRILVITLETSKAAQHGTSPGDEDVVFRASMLELTVLGGLIVVMVASIHLLRRGRLHPIEA